MELSEILAELPEDRLYAAECDLWLKTEEDGLVTVGANRFVTHHGQFMLFYPRPCETPVMKGRSLGVMETAKTAVAIEAPISCEIVQTNQSVQANVDVAIADPYGQGWLYKIRPSAWDEDQLGLMTVAQYRDWLSSNNGSRLRPPDPHKYELPEINPQDLSY